MAANNSLAVQAHIANTNIMVKRDSEPLAIFIDRRALARPGMTVVASVLLRKKGIGAMAIYRRYPGSMSTSFERMWRAGRQVLRQAKHHHGRCAL